MGAKWEQQGWPVQAENDNNKTALRCLLWKQLWLHSTAQTPKIGERPDCQLSSGAVFVCLHNPRHFFPSLHLEIRFQLFAPWTRFGTSIILQLWSNHYILSSTFSGLHDSNFSRPRLPNSLKEQKKSKHNFCFRDVHISCIELKA